MVGSLNSAHVHSRIIGHRYTDSNKALRFQHHCVSSIGGFLGTYSIINYHELLAAAQTTNMMNVIIALLGGNLAEFLIRVGAIVVYLLGFLVTLYIPRYTKINLQAFSLCVDILTVIAIAIAPSGINDVISLYPMFFAMAVQWNSFAKVEDYVSSTIFSTNNLKQATVSLMEYIIDGKKDWQRLDKSRFFGGTILGYHIGVALAFCSCNLLGSGAIWICCIPILISFISHIRVRHYDV